LVLLPWPLRPVTMCLKLEQKAIGRKPHGTLRKKRERGKKERRRALSQDISWGDCTKETMVPRMSPITAMVGMLVLSDTVIGDGGKKKKGWGEKLKISLWKEKVHKFSAHEQATFTDRY